MICLVLRHGGDENIVNDVASSIETICEETGCRMEWGDPTKETLLWSFFFRDERQEECARSMLLDLVHDYPYCVTVDWNVVKICTPQT